MRIKKLLIIFLLACLTLSAQQKFRINLNDRSDNLFKVTLYPYHLSGKNDTYHFAASAPGMYQIIDAGRFVRSFKAYDKSGHEIKTDHKSTNDWTLPDPATIDKIEYTIADTWHTPVDKNYIYEMGGTSLEDDNAVINGGEVFGYFEGKQDDSIYVKLDYPDKWEVGTALKKDSDGYYHADNYDHIVDSPIMLGRLSKASVTIDSTIIDIFTYSKTDVVKSLDIMESAKDIFHALAKFVKKLPIERYVLLFNFENKTVGALEHSYSSFYVYKENPFSQLDENLRDVIAHETFHMITPLHLHSEMIEKFNFVHPVLSQHLWLYEGSTEWAADMMQLRAGLVTLEEHLTAIRKKLIFDDYFDKTISLKKLALESYELQQQFQIIYQRGAVTSELLDILLLKLSGNKHGLRELILELSQVYGKDKSFEDNNFFDEVVKRTYPEVRDFINNFIIDAKPLPVKEYFGWLGIDFYEKKGVDSSKISLGLGIGLEGEKIVITKADENSEAHTGDVILKINHEDLTLNNFQKVYAAVQQMKPGDDVSLTVSRDGTEKDFDVELKPLPIKYIFEVDPNATSEQLALRDAWMKNL